MTFFGPDLRNGLPIGLGSVAGFGIAPRFSPASLFAGGTVQGAWYDPSDLTTLFQDSAGTTPVTAVEQPVGLMLDKSKGLVLGPELVTNGDFSSGTTGWTLQDGTISVSNGELTLQNPGVNFGTFGQAISTTIGRTYRVTATARCGTAASTNVVARTLLGSGNIQLASTTSTTNVTLSFYFTATATTTWLVVVNANTNNGTSVWDNFSFKELPGNHAYQSTSASRPTLRARYNLLTRSEEFNDAVWTKNNTTATANVAVAPDGTTTADKLVETATTGVHLARQNVTVLAGISYAATVYLKASERNFGYISVTGGAARLAVAINLTTGALSSVVDTFGSYSGISAVSTNVGSGWWRISLVAARTAGGSDSGLVDIGVSDDLTPVKSYTGDGTSGIFIWGAQLVPTAVFPSNTYQRVGAATDYATGAAFPPYLAFDGIDDSMLTNSVDFSGTDKMLVVAGVTKQSDAADGIIAELSTSYADFGGWYLVNAVSPAGYQYAGRGSRAGAANDAASAPIAGPNTSVLTAQQNLNNNTPATIRRNGALAGSSVNTTFGGGNFGYYPLYIGRRGNSTFPFNGNLYSLIIAGQSYTAAQISSTESWVAAKTPLGTI